VGSNDDDETRTNGSVPLMTIVNVSLSHEADSKMVKQGTCLRRRCYWPRSTTVPEVSSGSLRWSI